MVLFDWVCPSCETVVEQLVDRDTSTIPCPLCGAAMTKFFGNSAGNRLPDDAAWLKTITDVLDKDSKAPHIREFFKFPTRENLRILMKKEGIRHMDRGEEVYRRRPDFDDDAMADRLLRMKRERETIVVGRR